MILRTKVFRVAAEREILTDTKLAAVMKLSPSFVGRVRRQEVQIGPSFIAGAQKAFPDLEWNDLFYWEDGERPKVERSAAAYRGDQADSDTERTAVTV